MSNDIAINAKTNTFSTLDSGDAKARIIAINAINNPLSLKDFMNETLQIVDIVCMDGKRSARGNMPETDCINTYLIDGSGKAYFTQSQGVAKAAQSIYVACNGDIRLLYNAGGYIPIRVIENTIANGNTIKTLIIEG